MNTTVTVEVVTVAPSVVEEIFLHIDMETRLTAPWPDDVAAAMDAQTLILSALYGALAMTV